MHQFVLANGQPLTLTAGIWDLPEDDEEVVKLVEKGILEPIEAKKAPAKPADAQPKEVAKTPPIVAEVPKVTAPPSKPKEKAPKAPKPPKEKAPKVVKPAEPEAPAKPADAAPLEEGAEEGGEWDESEIENPETPPVTEE